MNQAIIDQSSSNWLPTLSDSTSSVISDYMSPDDLAAYISDYMSSFVKIFDLC